MLRLFQVPFRQHSPLRNAGQARPALMQCRRFLTLSALSTAVQGSFHLPVAGGAGNCCIRSLPVVLEDVVPSMLRKGPGLGTVSQELRPGLGSGLAPQLSRVFWNTRAQDGPARSQHSHNPCSAPRMALHIQGGSSGVLRSLKIGHVTFSSVMLRERARRALGHVQEDCVLLPRPVGG